MVIRAQSRRGYIPFVVAADPEPRGPITAISQNGAQGRVADRERGPLSTGTGEGSAREWAESDGATVTYTVLSQGSRRDQGGWRRGNEEDGSR